ncbi:MAG TPA: hypothetical protein VFE33_04135 [Thermoanaerobaculia bacterium]|nr:hypothetical protein [Thermoanaerobaculia bacterium]
MGTKTRSLPKTLALFVAVAFALAWGLGRPHADAAPPAKPAAKPAPTKAAKPAAMPAATGSTLCNLSSPPNLGTIAKTIAPNNNAFISDYNTLSQAAWCTFIALNWPAQGTAPTMNANPNAKFGTAGATEVWETWMDSTEVYCSNGNAPGNCSTSLKRSASSRKVHRLTMANPNSAHAAEARLQAQHSADPRLLAAVAGDDQDLSENTQATGYMLPDKNNTPANNSIILYEVRENPSFVSFLTKWGIYNRNGQTTLYNAQGGKAEPPGQSPLDFSPQAFEVKPSWYVIPNGENDPMYVSQGACAPGVQCGQNGNFNIGLTGFHVLWKVFPKSSWIWMTFEYNQNPALTPVVTKAITYTRPDGGTCPNGSALPCPDGPYIAGNPTPTDPVQNGANAANAIYQPMLAGTPFANYKLVGVQVAFMVNGVPTLLANNHIETDFGATNTLTNPTSSCITCHYYASIGNLNTNNCSKGKSANVRRIGIFQTTTQIPNMQAFGTGYTGNGQSSLYNASGSSGPYVAGDFIWTLQLSQWNLSQGNGCPSTTQSKPAPKPKPVKKPTGRSRSAG